MCNDIIVFEDLPVIAGFTTRCDEGRTRRDALAKAEAKAGRAVVRLSLVHGTNVVTVEKQDLPPAEDGILDFEDTDGAITSCRDITLTTTHGDCAPVYMYDTVHKAIGLAHAGWRGTLAGMAAQLLYAMASEYGTHPRDVKAYIGPSIGFCCFEVSEDVMEAFSDKYPWVEQYACTRPNGKFALDLKGINSEILDICGVEDVEISHHCTCCEDKLFYSYRREKDRGRMLAYIKLKGEEE